MKKHKPTTVLRGRPLNVPIGVERRYRRDVNKIVSELLRETEREIAKFFATPDAQEFFAEDASVTTAANKLLDRMFKRLSGVVSRSARKTSRAMVGGVDKSSMTGIGLSLKELSGGVTIDPLKMGGDIAAKLSASIESNVDLITSISDQYLGKVSDAVYRSIMTGRGLADLQPFMEKQRGITSRHARNVAMDQTRKAYASLNVVRMRSAGISKFEWLHHGGAQQPRKFHMARFPAGLNGGIYDINDPPIADPKTGERALPAEMIYCGCSMIPVIVLDQGQIAA